MIYHFLALTRADGISADSFPFPDILDFRRIRCYRVALAFSNFVPSARNQRTITLKPVSIPAGLGSTLSLVSTTSSMYSTPEEKQAHEIRRLRKELEHSNDKVVTLTAQLTTNVSGCTFLLLPVLFYSGGEILKEKRPSIVLSVDWVLWIPLAGKLNFLLPTDVSAWTKRKSTIAKFSDNRSGCRITVAVAAIARSVRRTIHSTSRAA